MSIYNLRNKNPDILTCLANLSNDEVFTPPKTASDMLNLLPPELFTNPYTKFLDPASKTGVFLREIVKRLIHGLKDVIPDLHERVEHIMRNQVYGIAVTDLTGMISRRTVYCSMNVQSEFSVCRFDDDEGRIRFREIEHTYGSNGRCIYCGAKRDDEGEEKYAYEFIHTERPEEILKMKFDVVISNPPYQMGDGGYGASAVPIYQKFVEQAKKLKPKYIAMIIPARWYAGGKGLDDFREEMLNDRRIRIIHDYPEADDCFSGVQIKGGVCYFLWDRDNPGDCEITNHIGENVSVMMRPLREKGNDTLIRYNEAIPILHKVQSLHEDSFADIVSISKPFGLRTYVTGEPERQNKRDIKLYAQKSIGYMNRDEITQNADLIDRYKVFIPRLGSGSDSFPHSILGRPFVGEPGTICTETYLLIGPFDDEETSQNVLSYIATKFFRFLVLLKKNTQDATSKVYSLVPMQDFTRPYTDEYLYAKYSLTPEEISFIDSMIRPMTLNED